jgi:HSP20 family protein
MPIKIKQTEPQWQSRRMRPWQEEIERMFGDFLSSRLRPSWNGRYSPLMDLDLSEPFVDLYEEKDDIVAKVELPGMEKDQIEIQISDHQLTVKGEKQKEGVKVERVYRSERSCGPFTRVLDLPVEVQTDKIHASYKNGVLEIRLPKTEAARKKEIMVKVE